MIRTYDGNSFKRVGGKPGDRSPAVGFTRLRVVYTATGGETSINLASLNAQFSYQPGSAHIDVKRSSGGSLISGTDFYETSSTTIGFPTNDPLLAGEIVEITRNFAVTGIAAIQARPDAYTAVGVSGQTLITADFSWPYNLSPTKGIGGVQVKVHGIDLTRGVDYTEVNLGTGNTNQIQLVDALSGGENIQIIPTYQVIDQSAATSTFNSQQLSNIQTLLSAGTQGFIDTTSLISVPATSIVNRAKIVDPSQDLRASFGTERMMTQALYQLQTEFGANGEPVWAAVNDDRGLLRFVGQWGFASNTAGQYIGSSSTGTDYAEVTFYGTGLNILSYVDSNSRSFSYSVDGGALVPGSAPTTGSAVISARNYNNNSVISVVQGLSFGIHTVKIVFTGTSASTTTAVFGFEVINAASATNVNVNPGTSYINGQKYTALSQQPFAYNSVVTGTKGGRVVAYQKADGTIGQSWQAVNAAPAYLNNSDHSSEEISRTYMPREFGAGRSDDFSTLSSNSLTNVAFTLDDGTTTLVGNQTVIDVNQAVRFNSSTTFVTFTFVGTGLDILRVDTGNDGTATSYSVTVDGASQGAHPDATASTKQRINKICSGLPYGTHTVKFAFNSTINFYCGALKFIVYQPKKPTVPSGAIELADYNVMASFAAPSNPTGANGGFISQGVIRKNIVFREATYTGTWNIGNVNATYDAGNSTFSTTNGAAFSYTFFGTGFDFRHVTASGYGSYAVSINGTALNASFPNASSITVGTYGYGTFGGKGTNSSGLLSAVGNSTLTTSGTTSYASGMYVTGLPLSTYTVTFTKVDTATTEVQNFDCIMPIYSMKQNLYADFQNTLAVGSNSLSDNRKTTLSKDALPAQKAWAQAVAVASSPTTGSTSFVPMPDMSVTVRTSGGRLRINGFSVVQSNTTSFSFYMAVYVDGSPAGTQVQGSVAVANGITELSLAVPVVVSPGVHKIDLYWRADGGTITAYGFQRGLLVEEV